MIRRGRVTDGVKKVAVNDPGPKRKFSPRPVKVPDGGLSVSEDKMRNKQVDVISNAALRGTSEARQDEILNRGFAKKNQDTLSPLLVYSSSYKKAQEVKQKYGFDKNASTFMGVGGSNSTVGVEGADTTRLAPEVYSPLFQIANLQLPRDRITMNAWNRNFYDTHPLVHNCINLHATYPISKINIRCKHKEVEGFFNTMIEELDMINVLHNMGTEFFKLGEIFPYAELDEERGMWKSIVLQNPDYIHVKKSVLGGDPVISLRPDAALQRLVMSSHPSDIQLRKQIDPEILRHVRKGNTIPLDNFHVSHLKMLSSPYDIRGTSMIVSIYKDLMLYDKLRECYSEDTDVFTDQGFVSGIELAKKYKDGEKDLPKIACFNPETEKVEFHKPTNTHVSDYKGEMYHFKGKKVDTLVTPNHRMWVSRKLSKGWSDWEFIQAKNMSDGTMYRFRSVASWDGIDMNSVHVDGHDVPTDLFLKALGYIISEGCVQLNRSVGISQNVSSPYCESMKDTMTKFADCVGCCCKHSNVMNGDVPHWNGIMYNASLSRYFFKSIGSGGQCTSHFKRIPRWVFNLPKSRLKVFLEALVAGDGMVQENSGNKFGYKYCSISKDLCDDVSEIAFRCGFSVNVYSCLNGQGAEYWVCSWTESGRGDFPRIYNNEKYRNAKIKRFDYNGEVWCFEVPTSLFITRRDGHITIQGNSKFAQADSLVNPITLVKVGGSAEDMYHPTSEDLEGWRNILESAQYDKDFKIVSHAGVEIQRIGASGAIIDIAGDMNFIIDNILYGLMTPKAIITQEGASYNSASIGLEVLKQRYESFRNMIAQWLKVKIFAPISEIQEFYDYDGGEKKLIVPEVDWNQMILFDMSDYINVLQQLNQTGSQGEPPKVSKDTLFRSLGLDPEKEARKVRMEMIQDTITRKEQQVAQSMSLSSLRALKEGEDIIESADDALLPGVPGAAAPGDMMGGLGGGLGGPPMGGGGFGGGGLSGPPLGGDMGLGGDTGGLGGGMDLGGGGGEAGGAGGEGGI